MSAELRNKPDSNPRGQPEGPDKCRLLSLWLASPAGRKALACQKRIWKTLTDGARKQRVLLIESPVEAWCSHLKEQGFFLTVSPRLRASYTNQGGLPSPAGSAEAEEWPFSDDEFDLAALLGGLEYLPDPASALAEAARVSRRGVVVITRNGAWPARLRAMAENSRGAMKWPALEHWFSSGALERLVRGIVALRDFKLASAGPAFFLKGLWFDPWLGCYFSPSYTMVADGLSLADGPPAQTAESLEPAASSRQLKYRRPGP